MNKKIYKGMFWLLMAICVALIILVQLYGIVGIVTGLAILYVGLGGFFVGVSWVSKSRRLNNAG